MAAETTIVIEGLRPYDGAYPIDIENEPLTSREWRFVKQISGLVAGEFDQASSRGDPDVLIAIATIALFRNHKIQREQVLEVAELLTDLPLDGEKIKLEGGEGAGETPLSGTTSAPEPSSDSSRSESLSSSGASSANGSESLDAGPRPIGISQ